MQDRTHPPEYYNPEFAVKDNHGTVFNTPQHTDLILIHAKMHVSVVDSNDMSVALTSTVNLIFGSWVLDQETGIIFNDEMDDFSIPGVPNAFGLFPSPCKLRPSDLQVEPDWSLARQFSGTRQTPTFIHYSYYN